MEARAARLEESIGRVFLGKPRLVRLLLTSLFAGGHVLLEDVPGVGKTILARSLAKAIDAGFRRVQFTPDLLPSDLVGTSIFNQGSGAFEFRAGPLFTNIVLADEINRTTPRTQSALLEAMNAASVSVDGTTHPLPAPFVVLATQNPHDFEGTYPLPESQLDRFLMRLTVGYPRREDELQLLEAQQRSHPLDALEPALSGSDVVQIQEEVRAVRVDPSLRGYLLDMVEATRRHAGLRVGISPRGGLALQRAAQAHAFLEGRDYVLPDDLKSLASPVWAHRLLPDTAGPGTHAVQEGQRILQEVLEEIEVPI